MLESSVKLSGVTLSETFFNLDQLAVCEGSFNFSFGRKLSIPEISPILSGLTRVSSQSCFLVLGYYVITVFSTPPNIFLHPCERNETRAS